MQKRGQGLATENFATEIDYSVILCALCGKCLFVSRDLNLASPAPRNAVIIGFIEKEASDHDFREWHKRQQQRERQQ